jgi:hypothetical protein
VKKLILLPCLFFTLFSFGQTWIEQGATWHYDWWNLGAFGFVKIEYTGDTTIAGQSCEILDATRYSFTVNQQGQTMPIGSSNFGTEYTYASGDTVFWWIDNQFQVLYNFGAQVGETWQVSSTGGVNCTDPTMVQVDSTGTTDINGQTYRWMRMSNPLFSCNGLSGRFIERFGASDSYLFPVPQQADSVFVIEYDLYAFRCFQDNSFSLYNVSNETCEFELELSTNESKLPELTLYPNPTLDFVSLENLPEQGELRVIDMHGRLLLREESHEKMTLDLRHLPPGIYSIQIAQEQSVVATARLFKL